MKFDGILKTIQLILGITAILTFIYFTQATNKICALNESIIEIEKKALPELRARQSESEAKIREIVIQINGIEKTIGKIDKNIEYLIRKAK